MFPPRRRGRRALRIAAGILVTLVIVVLLAAGAAVVFFDPNSLKPRIIAAVKRETGRDVAINGRIVISPSLRPTIQASDITFSNIQGGSSPTMATVARAEAQFSLLPLISHRLVITRLVLLQPHVLLERNSSGTPNWLFRRSKPLPTTSSTAMPAAAGQGAPAPPDRSEMLLAIQAVHIRDGEIRLRGFEGIAPTVIGVSRLDGNSASIASPIAARADLSVNGMVLTADMTAGSLARLQDLPATTPWPLNLTVEGTGLRVALAGEMTRPAEGRGYSATIEAVLGEDNPFRAALDRLTPLRQLRAIAHVADAPTGAAVWTKLALRGIGSGEPNPVQDLKIATFAFTADSMNDPIRTDVQGNYRDGAFSLSGNLVSPTGLLAARLGGPFPLDLTAQFAGADFHAKGVIGSYPTLSNVDVRLDVAVPDLITLSTVSRLLLPSMQNVALTGRISDADGTLFRGIALNGFKLTAPNGDLSGDVRTIYSGRPSLRATIGSQHLDLSGLAGVIAAAIRERDAAVSQPPKPAVAPAPNAAANPGAAQAAAPPSTMPDMPPPPPEARLAFSDRPLQLGFIQRNDLDIVVNLADLRGGGASYSDVIGHVFARNGDLTIDPLTVRTPGGKIDAKLQVNATAPAAAIIAELHAPAVAIAPLMTAFGLPDDDTGAVDVDVGLRGAGISPHDIAATLDGKFAISTVDSEIDNRILTTALGDTLRRARLPDSFGTGRTRLRCFAVKGDVAQGMVKVPTLVLDSQNLLLQGVGDISLGDERIEFRLRPVIKTGGQGVSVPLRVGGTLTAPKGTVDALAAIASFGAKEKAGGDPCPAALASVRGGQAGPLPAAPAISASPAQPPAERPSASAPKSGPSVSPRGSRG